MPIPRRRSFPAGAMRPPLLCGISTGFPVLSPCGGQVAYALLTRAPVAAMVLPPRVAPRLACVKPAASVHPEPGSNSPLSCIFFFFFSARAARSALPRPCPLSIPVSSNAFPVAFFQCAAPPRTGTDCKLKPFFRNLQAPGRLFSTRGGFFPPGPRRRTPLRRLRLQRYELQSFPSKFFKHFFRENSRHQAQLAA